MVTQRLSFVKTIAALLDWGEDPVGFLGLGLIPPRERPAPAGMPSALHSTMREKCNSQARPRHSVPTGKMVVGRAGGRVILVEEGLVPIQFILS